MKISYHSRLGRAAASQFGPPAHEPVFGARLCRQDQPQQLRRAGRVGKIPPARGLDVLRLVSDTAALRFKGARREQGLVHGPSSRAFSLIEILVVTGLLSVIIFGLVLMFGQTQRAFKLGTTQVDVLEGGRMVTDMLTREVAQMSPARQNAINCAVLLTNVAPLVQLLPGTGAPQRTNLLMEFFFLSKENQTWTGIGYTVLDPATGLAPAGGMGTLYRYSTNALYAQPLWQLFESFSVTQRTNMSRILDGVVHFKVRTYNSSGDWINEDWIFENNANIGADIRIEFPSGAQLPYPYGETPYLLFFSNAVPASVEIELGILEAKTVERARSISDNGARATYLAQQAGKVHVFRWRVPVRNVDATAYSAIP